MLLAAMTMALILVMVFDLLRLGAGCLSMLVVFLLMVTHFGLDASLVRKRMYRSEIFLHQLLTQVRAVLRNWKKIVSLRNYFIWTLNSAS